MDAGVNVVTISDGKVYTKARGRHAGGGIKNVLGGLARCGRCGGAMTRVTKGAKTKAGRPYLICEAAKVGKVGADGNRVCQYKAVHLEMIEQGLRDSLPAAFRRHGAPNGQRWA